MPLGVLQHNISPTEAFGAASVLAEQSQTSQFFNSELFGIPFQATATIIGIVYIFFIVRYWEFLRYFIVTALGIRMPNREKSHINPAEQNNIEVVMIILGVILLSLSAIRVCGVWYPESLAGIEPKSVFWVVGGVVAVALSLTLLFQCGTIQLAAAVCEHRKRGKELLSTKLLYMAVAFVVIIPFGLMFLLSSHTPATVGFWGMIFCGLIWLIIFVKETFLFFVSQKISILHWILYLCALEIFPTSLILAPILR